MDPGAILSACAESGVLDSLHVSATHCADRYRLVDPALEHHDAAVDAIYADLIEKASRSPTKSKA